MTRGPQTHYRHNCLAHFGNWFAPRCCGLGHDNIPPGKNRRSLDRERRDIDPGIFRIPGRPGHRASWKKARWRNRAVAGPALQSRWVEILGEAAQASTTARSALERALVHRRELILRRGV